MPIAQSISVTPSLLTWAREESGYPVERVASRLKVKEDRILAWEQGERQPTLKQVEKLAQFFHRPLGVFFLSRPPKLAPLAMEYRRLSGVEPGHESPQLRLALRQMLTRRENALNLMGELGDTVPEFRLRAYLREEPAEVGRRVREATGVDVATQLAWPNEWRAWNEWRSAVEQIGLLVFQFPQVKLAEVRGIALLRSPLPTVGINGKELPEAKPFTLFHEVVHLMLAAGHEESPALDERRSPKEWTQVERFAEAAASHALVPEDALQSTVRQLSLQGATWDTHNVRRLAKRFKLTTLAMATRLRESGFMTWATYNSWRADWQALVDKLPPKRRTGFATPEQKAMNRAGRPFAQLVLEALGANRITAVDASRYLDLKFQHFDNLRTQLVQGSNDIRPDE